VAATAPTVKALPTAGNSVQFSLEIRFESGCKQIASARFDALGSGVHRGNRGFCAGKGFSLCKSGCFGVGGIRRRVEEVGGGPLKIHRMLFQG
jgi:hypothetical protein